MMHYDMMKINIDNDVGDDDEKIIRIMKMMIDCRDEEVLSSVNSSVNSLIFTRRIFREKVRTVLQSKMTMMMMYYDDEYDKLTMIMKMKMMIIYLCYL